MHARQVCADVTCCQTSVMLQGDVFKGIDRMQERVWCYKCRLCASHEIIPQKGNDSLIISEGRGKSLSCWLGGKCRAQSCPAPLMCKAMQ